MVALLLAWCGIALAAQTSLPFGPGLGPAQHCAVTAAEADITLDAAAVDCGYTGLALNSNDDAEHAFWLVRIKSRAGSELTDLLDLGDYDGWAWRVPGGGVGSTPGGNGTARIELDEVAGGTRWTYSAGGHQLATGTCSARGADEVALIASVSAWPQSTAPAAVNAETRVELARGGTATFSWDNAAEAGAWRAGSGGTDQRPEWQAGSIYVATSTTGGAHAYSIARQFTQERPEWRAAMDDTTGELWLMRARRPVVHGAGCAGVAAYPLLELAHRAPGASWEDIETFDAQALLGIGPAGYSIAPYTVELRALLQTAPGQLLACLAVNTTPITSDCNGADPTTYALGWDTQWVEVTVPGTPHPTTGVWQPSGGAGIDLIGGAGSIGSGMYTLDAAIDTGGVVHALVADVAPTGLRCWHYHVASTPGTVNVASSSGVPTAMPGTPEELNSSPWHYNTIRLAGSTVIVGDAYASDDNGATWYDYAGSTERCPGLITGPQVMLQPGLAIGTPYRFDEQTIELWEFDGGWHRVNVTPFDLY